MPKKLIKNMLGTMIAIPLIGATASQVNALPAGTARDIAGIVPGLQSVALVGNSVNFIPRTKRRRR